MKAVSSKWKVANNKARVYFCPNHSAVLRDIEPTRPLAPSLFLIILQGTEFL